MSLIESLEGRVVFAATGIAAAAAAVLNDPTVAVTVAKVQVDRALVEAARADVREVATTGAAKVREIASAGKSLLAADRAQVKASRGDAAALADARETLKADWAKVRADLAAARDALKA